MKKSILFSLSVLVFAVSHGQLPNLRNVKNKATQTIQGQGTTNTKSEPEKSEPKSTAYDQSEAERLATLNSPAKLQLQQADMELKNVELYKQYWDNGGMGKLETVRINLDEARKLDPNFKYFEKYEARYSKMYAIVSEKTKISNTKQNIRFMVTNKQNFDEELRKYGRLNKNLNSRHVYDSLINIINNNKELFDQDSDLENNLKVLNDFFITDADSIVGRLIREFGIYQKEEPEWTIDKRGGTQWANSSSDKLKSIKGGTLDHLKFGVETINQIAIMYTEHPKITNELARLAALKQDFETYVSSGELDQLIIKAEARELEAVRMPKAGMQDASIESLVKTEIIKNQTENVSSVVRVVITSQDWSISRNSLGIILDKKIAFEYAYKDSEGNCYVGTGNVVRDFNGSSYEKMRLNYFAPTKHEATKIKCENVFK